MKKNKKKVSKKKALTKKELVLEEHIMKIIEELEKKPKDTIETVVKKEKPKKEAEEKKSKKTKKGKNAVYGRGKDSEYKGLEDSGIYNQVTINPFVGFVYKRNVKENDEVYTHLAAAADKTRDMLGEKNLASSEMMDGYAQKFTLNFLVGTDMNDITIEEKEMMKFNLYDQSQKHIYLAKIALMGFGYTNTTLKTTDFNPMGTTDKAA